MIRQRVHAGLKRAVANGKTLGRPLNDPGALERARTELQRRTGIVKVAKQVGLGVGTDHRIALELRRQHNI
jgi:DNA invertase Pin-like site-specific DNA recombinase